MKSHVMKIGVIGTRGFPEIQGGLETHCMELYTRISTQREDVGITVYRRKPYINFKNKNCKYKNIRFIDICVPKSKNLETLIHSFLATIHALFQRYDIIHIHNTGPGFFIPILRLTGSKIVFTYHNISYTQKKWDNIAKFYLRLTEKISLRYSDFVIFISDLLKEEMVGKYVLSNFKVISNGVTLPERSVSSEYIESLGLEKNKYILGVGRFLEEKGFDDLIKGFRMANLESYKLVLAGDTDYPTTYSVKLKSYARENNVILTGFIKGEKLNQLYSFARLYVISSYSEGMPIALLEAMSYNIDVLASDIPANLNINLEKNDYFKTGDVADLKEKILEKISEYKERNFISYLTSLYNWEKIAEQTVNIYNKLLI